MKNLFNYKDHILIYINYKNMSRINDLQQDIIRLQSPNMQQPRNTFQNKISEEIPQNIMPSQYISAD